MTLRNNLYRVLAIAVWCVLLILRVPSAFAADARCVQTACTDEIDRIYVTREGTKARVYISIEDRTLAAKTLKCKLVSNYYFTLEQEHPAFAQIFHLLVETKKGVSANKRNRITIRIKDNSPNCEIAYVIAEWPNNP